MAGKTPPGRADEFDLMNTDVTSRFIQALEASKVRCRVIVAGSAAELGPVPLEDLPVAEGYPCCPVEPYGWSKWRATQVALAALSPVEVVIGRVFNPIGPGLPGSQALGRFASTLADGEGPIPMSVGDLDARRDFIDVRDVADAFLALAHHGRAGQIYHLGTGQSHSIREGLARLIGLSGREVAIVFDPEFAQSRGPSDSRADIRKMVEHVGWSPRISWDQSLADLWQAAKEERPD
jgi:GDP-4-dehydro-6-deoxy-D-mannose reductase